MNKTYKKYNFYLNDHNIKKWLCKEEEKKDLLM